MRSLSQRFNCTKHVGLLIIMMLMFLSNYGYSEVKEVSVSVPAYAVKINGLDVQNDYREYPIIVYGNMPYFPLTYNDCRHLGFEMTKSSSNVMQLNQTNISALLRTNLRKMKNPKHDTATIVSYPVGFNDKIIESNFFNKTPFIVYRNVPYMPLQSSIILKQLNISCNFTRPNLLEINSFNLQPKRLKLAEYTSGPLLFSDGFAYYFDSKNRLIQRKVASNANSIIGLKAVSKVLTQLPPEDAYGQVYGNLSNDKGYTMLTYHTGGCLMGSDYSFRILSNGKLDQCQALFDNLSVKTNTGIPPGGDNLYIKFSNEPFKSIGEKNFIYGWSWTQNKEIESGGPTKDIYRQGDELYLLATNLTINPNFSRISKVNLKDGKVVHINNMATNHFVMENIVAYTVSNKTLYKINTDSGLSTSFPVNYDFSDFDVLGGILYGVSADSAKLIAISSSGTHEIGEGAKVTNFRLRNGYIVCIFEEKPSNPYRLMIFNKRGETAYKTSDVTDLGTLSIDHDVLYYVEAKTHAICQVQLANQ